MKRTTVDLLHRLPIQPCDVLVLDLALPAGSGMDLISKIKVRCPHVRIISDPATPEMRSTSVPTGMYSKLPP